MASSSLLASRNGVSESGYFRSGTALSRILCEAPYLARCSDDKTATRLRPRQYAIAYPYMQINRPGMTSWLIFDLDHPHPGIWETAGLPAPNLIVRNRHTNHSHLFWAIEPVCTSEKGRSRPIAYMRAVYAAMAARLKADLHFASGPVAKVPGHPWWNTEELHHKVHSLGDLAEYIDLAPRAAKAAREASHSRHCILFEALRRRAYALVGHEARGGYEAFFDRVLAEAHALNHFSEEGFARDLPHSSLRATAKSIARYTWERRDTLKAAKHGVMDLSPSLPLLERQRLAAARTARLRTSDTEARIRAAVARLGELGSSATHSAIAEAAGVSRRTVARYAHLLEPPGAQSQRQLVPFGGPQVIAPRPPASRLPVERASTTSLERRLLDASSPARPAPRALASATTATQPSSGQSDGRRRSLLEPQLEELRSTPLHVVIDVIGGHRVLDRTYRPFKNAQTERWHVSSARGDFELLVTGIKWYDTRAERGGGGAVDLVMHLMGDAFTDAVARLSRSRKTDIG